MKALLSRHIGESHTPVLEELPPPEAMSSFPVVEVKVVGVSFPDTLIIEDKYERKQDRPFAPRGEIAGWRRRSARGATREARTIACSATHTGATWPRRSWLKPILNG